MRRRITSAKRTPASVASTNQNQAQGVKCNELLCSARPMGLSPPLHPLPHPQPSPALPRAVARLFERDQRSPYQSPLPLVPSPGHSPPRCYDRLPSHRILQRLPHRTADCSHSPPAGRASLPLGISRCPQSIPTTERAFPSPAREPIILLSSAPLHPTLGPTTISPRAAGHASRPQWPAVLGTRLRHPKQNQAITARTFSSPPGSTPLPRGRRRPSVLSGSQRT